MKYLFVATFILVLGGSQALKCFECKNCDEKVGSPQTCEDNEDVCMKVVIGDHIVKNCGSQDSCGLGKLERAGNRIWTSIENTFKDVDKDAALTYCCDDDFCNGAIAKLPSIAVVFLPLLLVAFLKV